MTVTVLFEENGDEYTGYLCASDVQRVSFDPEYPKVIRLDGIRLELDERISGVTVDGYGDQTIAEPWELPHP